VLAYIQCVRAALIYNPSAGSNRACRLALLERAGSVLQSAGHGFTLVPTRAAGSAGEQAAEALQSGHDTVFACGGDGTVHDVLQGVMQSSHSRTATLGVLPFGTGNVLINDLGFPRDPIACMQAQLQASVRRIALGKITCDRKGETVSRYFITTAGLGPDAEMLYRVTTQKKDRWGLLAYVYEAAKLSVRHGFPPFHAEYTKIDGAVESAPVSQIMAVRITNFGNFMRRFAPGASLTRNDMQLVLFRTRRWRQYASYLARTAVDRHWQVEGVDLVHATELRCQVLESEVKNPKAKQIFVEADGEVLGNLPATIEIVPDAVNIFMKTVVSNQ
jgi:diacylglycerol kinase (ATP)